MGQLPKLDLNTLIVLYSLSVATSNTSLGSTILVLIQELEIARCAKGMSRRHLAKVSGVDLGTVRAWMQGRSEPGAVRLAASGLVLGLRLELVPKPGGVNSRQGQRNPPPSQNWWVDRGREALFQDPDRAEYLVNLAIAEIRWEIENKQIVISTLHRGTRIRTWQGHQEGRSPTVRTLLLMAEPVGLTFGWVPEVKSWRLRPWQRKWVGEHPLTGSWRRETQSSLSSNNPPVSHAQKSIAPVYVQLSLFE